MNYALMVFLLLGSSALQNPPQTTSALDKALSNYEVIRMEPSDGNARVRASNRFSIRLRSGRGVLDFRLEQRNLLSSRYHAEVTGEDGVRRQLPLPPVTTYKGTVLVGQKEFPARFTIDEDRFEGVVFTPGNWTFIEPLRHYSQEADSDALVVYRQSDIKPDQRWRCGVPHRLQQGPSVPI